MGILVAVVVLVLLVVPVVVMLLAPPAGTPYPLPDVPAILLFAAVGALVGLVALFARVRPLRAGVAALVLLVVAVWLHSTVWPALAWMPSPPLLPTVPGGAALAAGVFLAVGLLGPGAARGGRHAPPAAAGGGIVLGVIAAAAVLLVTEGDVWARGVIQRTFEGPGGMTRPVWLGLLFVAVVVAGFLVGAVISSRHRRLAALVALVLVALAATGILVLGELAGQPRTTRYGLVIGLLLVALLAALRRSRGQKDELAVREAADDADAAR